MVTEKQRTAVIALCRELIQRQSISGEEKNVADRIKMAFQEWGYDEILTDDYGNVIGGITGRQPGKTILFDGHIDTVPVPDAGKWQHPPFAAEIEHGRIYGRGASDMKGAVSAMIAAVGEFAAHCKKNFSGKIYVAGVVHEECFEGVAARKISQLVKPDYVVIGEASELNLKRGQRGRAEIVLETFGKAVHSANPQHGVNAVYNMAELIQKVRGLDTPDQEILGAGILELTDIKSSPYPGASVVPDYCRATYDRRLLVGESPESVLAPLNELIESLQKSLPGFQAKASFASGTERCYTGSTITGKRFFPGWLYNENNEFVQIALSGLTDAGLQPEITQYSFCTNASHYAGEAGIPTIGFGPSRENLAHTIDEYIEIEQLIQAMAGYYGILKSLFKIR